MDTTTPASETPRVDAHAFPHFESCANMSMAVPADFARALERDLTASNTALAEARERVEELEARVHSLKQRPAHQSGREEERKKNEAVVTEIAEQMSDCTVQFVADAILERIRT